MSDVLSQEEIDKLLNAMNNGEVDVDDVKPQEPPVKDYDFSRPSKFSKEHLRTLEVIFEHYGRLLSTNLPVYLRKNVQADVMNSEAVTYQEFTNSLSNPVLLSIVDVEPLKGNIIMDMGTSLGFAIVDRMLGGEGEPLEKERDFSEIEILIIQRVLNTCVELLREPWQNVCDIHPKLNRIETNSQFAQIISPAEMIAIVTMNLKIGDVEGMMNICLPYITLEPVMDKLNTKFWFSNMQEQNDKAFTEDMEKLIQKTQVPVTAVLGNSTISVNDFISLQNGDIIRLDKKADDELDVYVGSIKKFNALPGTYDNKYAVRVTNVIREEEG
ncbi:MAG: flagellar motor switch protein FliM [Lachnospiraceae bacterium]|uniref:Flagellar motor switch protein FliM n=1 Tax=Candidatus Weimeria bifida TaxID=2599074 RepID=A0A6N7J057_9FIRM|nr:flagellar motor switch protein FliM [Candidatus Weimeria bifida]RRF96327.1 MAG: flagellar motor switch protein FliM [Lachnospiraceae bacterium]